MKKYDYLIVGAGLFGAVFAQEAKKAGKNCLVIDKRNHIAGNIYTEKVLDIDVHQYGAHIFHTSNETVWNYVNSFAKFNRYTNSPVANYNYFNDDYQGIPVEGYTKMIERMLDGVEVKLEEDFLKNREAYMELADKIVYTGMIDEYYNYCYGELEYRSLKFETEVIKGEENYQGNAVVNYTEYEVPFTRIIEHKHFTYGTQPDTVITREYPKTWSKGDEPYYPMNDEKNLKLYEKYADLAAKEGNVIFGGRLGMYKYYDMDDTIEAALNCVQAELAK